MDLKQLELSHFKVISEETAEEYLSLRDKLFPIRPDGSRSYPHSIAQALTANDNKSLDYIVPTAQNAVKFTLKHGPATWGDVYAKYPHLSANTINQTLSNMCKMGVIHRIKHGTYMLSDGVLAPAPKKLKVKNAAALVEAYFDANPAGDPTLLDLVAWGKEQGHFFGYDRPLYELRKQTESGVLRPQNNEHGYLTWSRPWAE